MGFNPRAPGLNQPALPLDQPNMRAFEPVSSALEGARQFTHGGFNPAGLENVRADPRRGFGIQSAYKVAQGSPQDPMIRRSYAAMRNEVNRQYEFMTRPRAQGGMGIQHEVVGHEPYWDENFADAKSAASRMAEDVARGRIQTHATEATGGHAFFSNPENDRFRAVHDVFGHAAIGRGFDRNGEEAAYLSHRQMFSKAALTALTSETRGQNSYLNYGATLGNPSSGFPDQAEKLVRLPPSANRVKRPR